MGTGEASRSLSTGLANVNWWIFVRTTGLSAPFCTVFLRGRSIWDRISQVQLDLDFFVDLCNMGTGAPFFIRSDKSSVGLRLFQVGLRARSDFLDLLHVDLCQFEKEFEKIDYKNVPRLPTHVPRLPLIFLRGRLGTGVLKDPVLQVERRQKLVMIK